MATLYSDGTGGPNMGICYSGTSDKVSYGHSTNTFRQLPRKPTLKEFLDRNARSVKEQIIIRDKETWWDKFKKTIFDKPTRFWSVDDFDFCMLAKFYKWVKKLGDIWVDPQGVALPDTFDFVMFNHWLTIKEGIIMDRDDQETLLNTVEALGNIRALRCVPKIYVINE